MSVFRYGRDYYTSDVAQQLLPAAAWLLLTVVGASIAVHLLRRSAGHPAPNPAGTGIDADRRVLRHERGARLYHWATAIVVLGLAVSGIALFVPGTLGPMPWLLVHEVTAVGFIALLALHVMVAPRRGDWRTMWLDGRDMADLGTIAANFAGRTRRYPAFGKYDPLQKLHHALLTVLAGGFVVSGAPMLLSAEAWATFGHGWMRAMRLVHDVSSFSFLALLVGHVYFSVIRVNWPQLVSMCTGYLNGASFNRRYDANRWRTRHD